MAKILVVDTPQAGRAKVNKMQGTARIPKALGRFHAPPGQYNNLRAIISVTKEFRSVRETG